MNHCDYYKMALRPNTFIISKPLRGNDNNNDNYNKL